MCPRHRNIIYCPLYVGMHMPGGPSCWHERLPENLCAVALGADYDQLVATFAAKHPREYATLKFNEAAAESKEQRARNMRAAGIH
jgi:hypothetical protein